MTDGCFCQRDGRPPVANSLYLAPPADPTRTVGVFDAWCARCHEVWAIAVAVEVAA